MHNNKRGQGMSVNTIIILILAVVVLVVLILGFSLGWNKVTPWISNENVDDVVTACSAACATNSQYDFCGIERVLRDAEKKKYEATCAVFASVSEFDLYGIESCGIECQKSCGEISINKILGTKAVSFPANTNYYDVSSLANDLDDTKGEICYIPLP
jgi:hypothetical protein